MNEDLRKYLEAFENDPESEEAFTGLEDVLTSDEEAVQDPETAVDLEKRRQRLVDRHEWKSVIRLLELELLVAGEMGEQSREVELTFELARISLEKLHHQQEGLAYLEKVLALAPAFDEAVRMHDELVAVREKWEEFVQRFADEATAATEPSLKTSLFYRAAEALYRNSPEQIDEVLGLLEHSLEADPRNQQALDLITLILGQQGRWKEIAQLYFEASQASVSKDERLKLLKAAARIYANQAGDQENAALLFRQVLDAVPGHPGALAFLADYYDEQGQWEELISLYEDALKGRPRGEAEHAILFQIGMVHWKKREDFDTAEEYFQRLRKANPSHAGMLQFFRELAERKDDPNRLLQVLNDAQRVARDPEEKVAISTELARVAERKADNPTKAIDAWKQVLRLDPQNQDARDGLRRLYETAEQWNALLDLLKSDIEVLDKDDVDGRVAIMKKMVAIYRDKLSHDPMVINTYNGILRIAPDNREALEELSTVYDNLGRYSDLTRVLERRAKLAGDPDEKIDLLSQVAKLWVERFNNLNKAVEPLEQVLELDPVNVEALSQLKAIYSKRRAWKPLYEVIRREADMLEGQEQVDRLAELAKLASDRLDKPGEAIELWEKVYEADPEHEGVLDELERLTERQRDWEGLARVLERRLDQAEEGELVPLLIKLGTVYGDRLDDAGRSAAKWRRVLELQPGHPKAVRVLKEAYVKTRDIAALEELYERLGDYEGLVEVLSNTADKSDEDEEKITLSFKAASIFEEKIDQPGRAQRSYERVLSVDETNEQAARALLAIYNESGQWPRLQNIHQILLEHTEEGTEEHLEHLIELRDLCAERLGERGDAFRWAARAYAQAPGRTDLRETLEERAGEADAWEELLEIYENRSQATDDDEERLELLRRVARLSADVLGRPDDAVSYYQRVLELQPGDEEALATLERIYAGSGQFRELLGVYETRLERAEDPERRRMLLKEVARIHEEGLDDPEAAATAYRQVLELQPDDDIALSALERMASEGERWGELVEILEARRKYSEGPEATAITFQLASLLSERLHQPTSAIDELSGVLEEHPGHPEALDALEPFLDDEELKGRVATLMEPHLQEMEDYERLARVLTIILEEQSEPEEKVALFKRLATVQVEFLQEHEAGVLTLGSALELAPTDRELWERLDPLAELTDANGDLAEMFAEAYESEDIDDDSKMELAARLADIYDMRLGDPNRARRYHEFVLDHDPGATRAFEALESLFTTTDNWQELLALYRKQAERVVVPDRQRELLLNICFIYEEVLDKADDAIEWYVRVLDIDPDDERANESLELLYAQTERWRDLASLLENKLGRASEELALDLRFRLGGLNETHLEEPSTALDYYDEVLRVDPSHTSAQVAMERLLEVPDLRQRAASILEPIYADQGRSAELVRVLEVQLEAVSDPIGQVELLSRIGFLLEQNLDEPMKAFDALARAFEAQPVAETPRAELRRLADTHDIHERYCAVLEGGIQSAADDITLVCELLAEVAALYEIQLEDNERAESAYRRLLNTDPDNPATALPAARSLESLYHMAENWPKLVEILRLRVQFADAPEDRRELLARVAEIHEADLDQPVEAIETYREILDVAPDDITALHHLERLYGRTENWTELIAVLRRRIELSEDRDEQRELHFRIARLYEESLDNLDDALVMYHTIQAELGPDREATRALVRLYERTERWIDLLDALELDLELCEDADERATLLCRMGSLHRHELDEPERAVDRYREVVRFDTGHAEARAALEEMLEVSQVRLEAAKVLAPLYEAEGSWDKLVSVLVLQAEEALAPTDRWAKLREAAEVAEVGLEDSAQAFDLMARALRDGASEPHANEIVATIERLGGSTGRHGDLIAQYQQVVPDVLDGDLQLHMMLQIAGTAHRELGDLELARDYYVRILDNFGDHTEAMDALEEIYRATEAHMDLLEIYRRKTNLAETDDERRRLLLLQAELCELALENLPEAMRAYESILDIGDDSTAIEALERLYEQTERYPDLAALLERQLGTADGAEMVVLHYRLGELHRTKLNDPDMAIDHYRAALDGDPRHSPTVVALETLMDDPDRRGMVAEMLQPFYKAEMDWAKLVDAIEARLETIPDPHERKPLLLEMGEIYEVQMEELEKAFETYARMFRDDIEDPKSRDLLSRLANVLDAWPRLAETYQEALDDVLADTEGTAELAFVLGQIYDVRCDDHERARDAYRRVLAFDPEREDAFRSLEGLFQRTSSWRDLLDLYREAADRSMDMDVQKDFLFKMAQTQEEMLKDPAAAIDVYREVLDVDERDDRAIAALDRLYYYQERWTDLADLFQRRIEQSDDYAKKNELRCQLGGVYEERLEDIPSAIDCYEQVLEVDPDHLDATAALERLIMNEDERYRIAKILEPIYEMHDQWKKLVVIYDAEMEFIEDRDERVRLRREIARLHEERGGDITIAFTALAAAFTEEPESDEILEGLKRLADERDSWEDFVDALEKGLANSYDTYRQAELLRIIARTQDQELGDPRAAIKSYKRLLEVDDRDAEALDSLEGLFTLVGDWSGQIDTLERKAEMADMPDERKDLFHRVGAIYEDMIGDLEKSIDAYRRAYLEDDTDFETIAALERLYTQGKQWNDLIDVLRRRLDLEEDLDSRVAILHRVAEVFNDELEDTFEATNAYQAVLTEAPEDMGALDALDRLHLAGERWPELLEVLQAKAQQTTDPEALVEIRLRIGKLQQTELLDHEAAIETFREVLVVVPDNEEALGALEKIAENDIFRFAAAEVLEPLLRQAGAWERLSKLKELKLVTMDDPGERIMELRSLAEIAEDGMGDPEAAFSAHVRALAEDVGDEETHEHLQRLAEQLGAWDKLAEAYEERAGQVFDVEHIYSLNLKLGAIYEEQLDDNLRAIEAYRRALDAGGEEGPPLSALDRLYLREEKWTELAEILEREMTSTLDESTIDLLEFRLGTLREEKFGDLSGAIGSYRAIVERNSDHLEAMEALERLLDHDQVRRDVIDVLDPLYRERGDNAKLADLYRLRVQMAEEMGEKVALLNELAQLQEQQLSDPESAMQSIADAFRLEPGDSMLLGEFQRLTEQLGAWPQMVEVLERVLSESKLDTVQARELGILAARCYDERLDDPEQAEERYRAVLVLEPENAEVLGALETLLRRTGHPEALVPVLRQRAIAEFDLEKKKELFAEAAQVSRDDLGDTQTAAACYESILELDEMADFALDALAAIREEEEKWDELAELLVRRARYCEDLGEGVRLRHRVAALQSGPLSQPERAIDTYREILDADPGDRASLEALERLLSEQERWLDLQEVLVRRLDNATDEQERVEVMLKQADLAERQFQSVEDAVDALRQVLEIDPTHEQAAEKLEQLLSEAERWEDLVDVLEQRAQLASNTGRADDELQLLVRIGDIWEQKLSSEQAAIEIYEKVLARDPDHTRALGALARLHEAAGDWDKCAEVLEKAAGSGGPPEDVAEVWFRLGRLNRDQREDQAAAEACFLKAVDLDPTHSEAVDALRQILEAKGDHAQIAALLEQQEAATDDKDRKLELLRDIGHLYLKKLGEADRAVPFLERARELEPLNKDVLLMLVDVYLGAGRQADAVPVLKGLIEAETEVRKGGRSKELAVYHHRLGQALQASGDRDGAKEQFESAYKIDLGNVDVLASLGMLHYEDGELDKAMKVFRGLLLQRAESATLPKSEIYYRMGDIYMQQDDKRRALGMFQRGLEADKEHLGCKSMIAEIKGS